MLVEGSHQEKDLLMRLIITTAAAAMALAAAAPAFAQSATAQSSPAQSGTATDTSATAPASASGTLAVGLPVKDKTGAVIGEIADLKAGPEGQQATVKMGDQSFAIGASSFVVMNGAAVINATQDQLKAMIAQAGKPG
jgi:hypothetical protein